MPQHKILCKYYMQGACLKGDSCQFSHSFNDPSNNVCTFYQRGICSYGSRCRYEHVKLPRANPYIPSPRAVTAAVDPPDLSNLSISENNDGISTKPSSIPSRGSMPPILNAWQTPPPPPPPPPPQEYSWEYNPRQDFRNLNPADIPICSYAAAGHCPFGAACTTLHGELCESCGKECIHPYRPEERQEHMESCKRNQKRLELLRMSQDIECSVCLERVLSKSNPAERKYGLLSGCDHPFCISCIRDWRGGSHPGMDLDTVVRACPVCRVASHYVIPSVYWYTTPEEKEEIVSGYKNKLSSIDCKYFDLGNGTCPFGTSCFYKHAYPDGTNEEVKLRHLGAADGTTVIAKNIRLSDFLVNFTNRN